MCFWLKSACARTTRPEITYFSYIGGSSNDYPTGVAISPAGLIAVTGVTYSSAFPTTTYAFQSTLGGNADAFVLEFNPLLGGTDALLFSSFFGGTGFDRASAVAFDPTNANIVVVGSTDATSLPVTGINPSYQSSNAGGIDMFILTVTPSAEDTAETLLYSSFYGGNLTDIPTSLAVDSKGLVYVAGYTSSAELVLAGTPYATFMQGLSDGLFAVFDLSQYPVDQLLYATYLGGDDVDSVTSFVLDANGSGVWLTGYTLSSNFPVTANAAQSVFTGYADAWVAHLELAKIDASLLTYSSTLSYSTLFNGASSTYGNFTMTMPYAIVLDSASRPMIGRLYELHGSAFRCSASDCRDNVGIAGLPGNV